MPIRRPLSPAGNWVEVSLFRDYAELARQHLNAQRHFEAVIVCAVGYDVLVNLLPDRISLHHDNKLTPEQRKVIGNIAGNNRLTAGGILKELKKADILHRRLDHALCQFNEKRNTVIHPIKKQQKEYPSGTKCWALSLKAGAVIPQRTKKEDAELYFRCFCHIIDLSGGESPLRDEKMRRAYPSTADLLRRRKEKRNEAKSPGKDENV